MLDRDLLTIYLQDHLAGATAGLELAKRAAGQNSSNALGPVLTELVAEIEEDRETLIEVMDSLDAGRDRIKELGAWTGEKLGRLKLNGRLLSYSPLSRLIELEGLSLGIEGKRSLWRSLERVAPGEPRLQRFDFRSLAERAAKQRRRVENQRLKAAEEAFGERTSARA